MPVNLLWAYFNPWFSYFTFQYFLWPSRLLLDRGLSPARANSLFTLWIRTPRRHEIANIVQGLVSVFKGCQLRRQIGILLNKITKSRKLFIMTCRFFREGKGEMTTQLPHSAPTDQLNWPQFNFSWSVWGHEVALYSLTCPPVQPPPTHAKLWNSV